MTTGATPWNLYGLTRAELEERLRQWEVLAGPRRAPLELPVLGAGG
jgi:hypothetical protein